MLTAAPLVLSPAAPSAGGTPAASVARALRQDLMAIGATELPRRSAGGSVRERSDAARNRQKVLRAAEQLFAERGVAAVTMDDVAAAAGVGKGTLYRRFGDKSGLAVALLDDREADLQQRIISGPAPLGPGAAAVERLEAFVEHYLDFLQQQLDIVLLSEISTPGARFRTGAHGFWRMHCRMLLVEAGAADPEIRAEVLLAALSAEQVGFWIRTENRSSTELAESLGGVARALSGVDSPPR